MKIEFKRYSLEKLRIVTGFLEILGGLGLLIGLEYTFILKLAALGLAMMMIAALFVRIKIKDSPLQSVPALTLLLINLFILFS